MRSILRALALAALAAAVFALAHKARRDRNHPAATPAPPPAVEMERKAALLERQLAAREDEIAELRRQMETLNDLNAQTATRLREEQEANAPLRDQIAKLVAIQNTSRSEIETRDADINRLREARGDALEKIRRLEAQLEQSNADCQALEREMTNLKQKLKR